MKKFHKNIEEIEEISPFQREERTEDRGAGVSGTIRQGLGNPNGLLSQIGKKVGMISNDTINVMRVDKELLECMLSPIVSDILERRNGIENHSELQIF